MPQSMQEKITASFIMATGILLSESLSYASTKNDFELTKLMDPRGFPLWLIQNSIMFLGCSAPKPIIFILKFLIPLSCVYIIMEMEDTTARQNSQSKNRHGLFNSELNQFNPFLESFIARKNASPSFKSQIETLKLTEEEENQLDEYRDCVTYELMETPVSVYGKNYDLNTVLKLDDKLELNTRIPFTLRDIQPMLEINNKIQSLIKSFHEARQESGLRLDAS